MPAGDPISNGEIIADFMRRASPQWAVSPWATSTPPIPPQTDRLAGEIAELRHTIERLTEELHQRTSMILTGPAVINEFERMCARLKPSQNP